MREYFCGASVKDAQELIFQNKSLREIEGVSEVVKGIFEEFKTKFQDNLVINELTDISNKKDIIAAIYIEVNGINEILSTVKKNLNSFLMKLDDVAEKSFRSAIVTIFGEKEKQYRNIILDGSCVTLFINADYALEFTQEFLKNFERNTSEIGLLKEIKKDKFTACAGIVYFKENYPCQYAENLATILCNESKKSSSVDKSCLMFYNIQSKKEITEDKFGMQKNTQMINLDFGQYYLDKSPRIIDLLRNIEAYRSDKSHVSRLRYWLDRFDKNNEYAEKLISSVNDIFQKKSKGDYDKINELLKQLSEYISKEEQECKTYEKIDVHDILQIVSVTGR